MLPFFAATDNHERGMLILSFAGICLFLFALFLFYLPVQIARKRGHPQAEAIRILTLTLGWTYLGWAIALTWAYMAYPESDIAPQSNPSSEEGRVRHKAKLDLRRD